MAKTEFRVPWKNGGIMHYADDRPTWNGQPSYYSPDEWRDRDEFTLALTIDHSISGRSAKYVIWLDDEGHQFPMFVTDLVELVKTGIIRRGRVEGVWRPAKRGANYGVQFVRDAVDDGLEGS